MKKVSFFYPGFVRKAITFTIDDGNMKYDAMLLDVLKPAGIKGTFNLCSNLHEGKESQTKEFYIGYEIANHCKHHPLVNCSDDFMVSEDEFNEQTSDAKFLYKVDGKEGFYWQMQPNGWRHMVFEDMYIRLVDEGLAELSEIFGQGSVRDFVWPYREMANDKVKEYVKKTHRSVRKTGCTLDTTGFAIPSDKHAWSYNANHINLLEVMEKYESYPDDGALKFFAFGVHSIDFERDDKWGDLSVFAEKYGNRPDTYWYASVGEIFDYEEALSSLEITESSIKNTSKLTIYLEINGERKAIDPGCIVAV